MKKLGIEDKIRSELIQGTSVKSLIVSGYKRSTVYKVNGDIRTVSEHITPQWSIGNIRFDKYDRHYNSGEAVRITFDLKNLSSMNLYVRKIGIQTEWMIKENIWVFQKVNEIVDGYWPKRYTIDFAIPKETELKEFKIEFLMEGIFIPQEELPITHNHSSTTLFIS